MNGIETSTISQDQWQIVAVTIDTGITANQNFNGKLDDIRVYKYTLTEQQVRNVMNDASAVRFTQ